MTSARTARKMIPAVFGKVGKHYGWHREPAALQVRTNLDLGGGPYDDFTRELAARHGIMNLVWDPHNRSSAHNAAVLFQAANCTITTGTISNVLNVMKSPSDRQYLLKMAGVLVDGPVFITVYEGNKTSRGKKTRDGWQSNRPLASYVKEVKKVFSLVKVVGGMIIAKNAWVSTDERDELVGVA